MGCLRPVRACFGLTQRAWAFLNSVLASTDVQIWSSRSLPEHFVRVGDSRGKGQEWAVRVGGRGAGSGRACAGDASRTPALDVDTRCWGGCCEGCTRCGASAQPLELSRISSGMSCGRKSVSSSASRASIKRRQLRSSLMLPGHAWRCRRAMVCACIWTARAPQAARTKHDTRWAKSVRSRKAGRLMLGAFPCVGAIEPGASVAASSSSGRRVLSTIW